MHLHRNELKDRALSLWTKYTVAGTSFTSVSPCSLLSASDRSNSWLLRVHHALPALVRRRRPRHRLFPRVSRAGPEALDRRRVLLYAPARPGVLSQSGPSLEVVRPPFPFRMRADAHGAHSYKRTYMPSSYHIAQEIQKYNIPDYRPRQEQCVPFPRACRLLTPPRGQVPKGDQEGARRPAHAAQSRLCVQPDGEPGAPGPVTPDSRVRHVKVGRAPVGVLIRAVPFILFGRCTDRCTLVVLMILMPSCHSVCAGDGLDERCNWRELN